MRRALPAALLALAGTACATRAAPPPVIEDQTRTVSYSLTASGEAEVRFEGPVAVQVRSLQDPRLSDVHFYIFQPTAWIDLGGGTQVRAGLDLIGYEGDGTYAIGDRRKATEVPTKSSLSKVWFDVQRSGAAPSYRRFDAGRCSISISGGGARGSATCASLEDELKREVSLELSWRAA